MQVPLIDRINDLQVGLNSLQNPSFPSHSQITTSLAFNFCKWGAVILALVATFGGIINRVVTIFIVRFRAKAPSLQYLNDDDDDDFYTSSDENDDNDDDDLIYSESDSEDQPSASSSFICLDDFFRLRGTDNNTQIDDEFQTQNGTHKRRRSIGDIFSLSELANSKSVVKLWDSIGFGLGLDFDDYDYDYEDGVVSSYDDLPPAGPASSAASPAVVVSAAEGACGNLALEIWDTRLRRRKPMVVAEWGPTVGKTLRVESGGVQKVYVRDDGRDGVTVGDMRKVSTPLGNVTESDADTWWDADAVVVSDESFAEYQSMLQQPA